MIPKVKFKIKPLEQYLEVFHYFLNVQKNNWDSEIFYEYPRLKELLNSSTNIKDRKKIIYDFFKEIETKKKLNFYRKRKAFQKSWNKINDKVLRLLLKISEVEWTKKDKNVIGHITLNPICPRYLKDNSFDLYYNFNISTLKTVAFHEIFHFIYFKKFEQVFPKISKKEYEGPGIVWELSEMIPYVVLSDQRIQKIHKHDPAIYSEYKTLKIGNRRVLDRLKKFYEERKSFEDFLRNSWNFIKKNEKIINKKLARK